MKKIGTRTLETSRLIMRKNDIKDFDEYFNIISDHELIKYYAVCKMGEDKEKDLLYFKKNLENYENQDSGNFFRWSIIKKSDNKFLGIISVFNKDSKDDIKDIGWYISKDEQGKGYGTEAAKEVIKYMFEDVEISAIETEAATINLPSWKMMEKLGMHKIDKELPVYNYYYAGPTKVYGYLITKEDYIKNSINN